MKLHSKILNLFAFVAMPILLSLSAQAAIDSNDVDALEAADAIAHCSSEASKLMENGGHFYNISARHSEKMLDGRTVNIKTITFESGQSRGFGRTVKNGQLKVQHTLTAPPRGMMDAPYRSEYRCSLRLQNE